MDRQHPEVSKTKKMIKTILITALIAASLDIIAAFVNAFIVGGRDPIFVLQFIASGIWGKQAFSGGLDMAFYGLLFHFVIASAWTVLFFIGYSKFYVFVRSWIVAGLLYGVVVWAVMNLVILPMTNVPKIALDPTRTLIGIAILMFCLGIPISFMAYSYYGRK